VMADVGLGNGGLENAEGTGCKRSEVSCTQQIPPRAAAVRLLPAACRPASLWRSDAWIWCSVAWGARTYPGSARGSGCVGRPQARAPVGAGSWAYAAGGKGRLNFLYSVRGKA